MDHFSRKMYYTNCVKKVKILKGVLLFTICKYESRYRLVVFGAMGYSIVWLFLELWDTVYLLVTSEYVFVAVPWEWVCYQMISQAEILDSIVW